MVSGETKEQLEDIAVRLMASLDREEGEPEPTPKEFEQVMDETRKIFSTLLEFERLERASETKMAELDSNERMKLEELRVQESIKDKDRESNERLKEKELVMQQFLKAEELRIQQELKEIEMKGKKVDRLMAIGSGIGTLGLGAMTLLTHHSEYLEGIQFETTGAVTSQFFRSIIGKLRI